MGKREEIRRQRASFKRRNKTLIVLGIIIFSFMLVAALTIPLINASKATEEGIQIPTISPRPMANRTTMGDAAAPVVVEEYSDFQCPYCKKFSAELEPAIVTDFVATGKIIYKYIPFRVIGEESDKAASAAYCAADQNKFWEFHDILFANQTSENKGDFTDDRLLVMGEKLNLNNDVFKSCYTSNKYAEQLKLDQAAGVAALVDGTPSFYVNGLKVDPSEVYQAVSNALAGN